MPCELRFPAVDHKLIVAQQQTTPDWITYHNVYAQGKGGFDAAVRVIRKDEGRETLVLIRIAPWKTPLPKEQSEAWAYSPDNPDFEKTGVFNPTPPLPESSVVSYRTTDVNTMLISSRRGQIELLPALPAAWPSGSVKGLCARGGFEVDIAWKDGKVTDYRIISAQPREVKLRVNAETKTVRSEQR